jgi:hypothetical protein
LRETGGSMSKAFNAGHASRCGLAAALLAARGFTGSETALEGPNGFIAAFGEARLEHGQPVLGGGNGSLGGPGRRDSLGGGSLAAGFWPAHDDSLVWLEY